MTTIKLYIYIYMMKNLQNMTFNMFAVNNHIIVKSHPIESKREEEKRCAFIYMS